MLKTKMMPPSSAGQLIERARLQLRFSEIERTRLALVRAPAGFGKTSLLSQWFHELRRRGSVAAWLSFDHADRDASGTLGYIVAALELGGYRFDSAVTSLAAPDSFATGDAIVQAVVNDLCRTTQPVFLFLDDVHVLAGAASAALMSLLERAPSTLHVVLASRTVPDLPLARARAFGNVAEFTAADLRFTKFETAEFMASTGTGDLDDARLALLDGRVEGWIAGLKLAAIASAGDGRPGGFFEAVSGRRWSFAEFFREVVTRQLSTALTDFLLATSLLDRFCFELCDAVTASNGARARLDEIEARGLFIFSLDGERKWYRYHHLFAEFLREELARRHPEGCDEFHARAARWFAGEGFHMEAFSHAVKANDFVLAAEILDRRCHTMFYGGEIRVLLDCAAQIPPALLGRYPRIELAKAWSLILQWKFNEARNILRSVEAKVEVLRAADARSQEYGLYLHCTMMLAQFEDDMPAVERQCATLLAGFMDTDPYLVGTYYTSLLYAQREQFNLRHFRRLDACARDYFERAGSRFVIVWHQSIAGPTLLLAGDVSGAVEALVDGLEAASAIGGRDSSLASIPALLLAEAYYERNETRLARELIDRHLGRAAELGFVDQLVAGYVTSSKLHRLNGDARAAERVLERGLAIAHSRGFSRLAYAIVAEQMTQALRSGKSSRVSRLAEEHDLVAYDDALLPSAGTTTGTQARAVAWTAFARSDGRSREALNIAKAWQHFTARAGAVRSAIVWTTIVAEILLAQGDSRAAEQAAQHAVSLAAPGRIVRTFLDLGRTLPVLLAEANDPFARELLRLANDGADGDPLAFVREPLNARELEIVRLVACGMSNRDIAERLETTEGTVKSYLHLIFDKVGARRRTQVVDVARRSGLLG